MGALSILPSRLCLALFPWYEVFLRCHHALAITTMYGLWAHLNHRPISVLIYLWVMGSVFVATLAVECLSILYRNYRLHRGCSRALIARQNGLVRMTIFVARPWKVKAGQHINIWIPSIGFRSLFQSHPFTIASCDREESSGIDLLIEPKDGFTRQLYNLAEEYQVEDKEYRVESKMDQVKDKESSPQNADRSAMRPFGFARRYPHNPEPSDFRLILFSGPHGSTLLADDYGKVVLIAEGNGIAAQVLILKELIQGFSLSIVRTRHIYVIWQLEELGMLYISFRHEQNLMSCR